MVPPWIGLATRLRSLECGTIFIADGKLHLLVEWEPDAEFFPVLDQEVEEIIDDVCKCPL